MKIDRLIAITMFLLNRDVVSASMLAKRFEVSKRTIQRDIETLCLSGIPIVSTYGSDGGYGIIDGFKLAKQIADADDYLNIITALKGLSSAYENKKINSTLEKASSFMRCGEQHVFVDFSVAQEKNHFNEYLQVIDESAHAKIPLYIEYSNAEGVLSNRTVEPLILSFRWYAWYLFAYCTVKKDYRLFKLSRISICKPTSGEFSKEHDNAEALMNNFLMKDERKYYSARILCKGEIRRQVIEYINGDIVDEYENGDFVMAINLPFERMWFSLLMGFGDKVRVLDSDELKDMLKKYAKEILSVY